MGLLSTIIDAVSTTISTVCSAFKTGASALGHLATELGTKLNPVIGTIITIIENVAKFLNLINKDEDMVEYGEKLLQAEDRGITLESCNFDYEKYKNEIDNFEIDPDIRHEKNECLVASTIVLSSWIQEKSPYLNDFFKIVDWSINDTTKSFFNPDRVIEYIKFADTMKTNINDICDYFTGKLDSNEFDSVDSIIIQAEEKLNPQKSVADINKDIYSVVQDLKK